MSARALGIVLLLAATACGRGGSEGARTAAATPFDGDKAMEYVRTQLAFGPRVPGSEAHRAAGDWIAASMRQRADTVIEQRWDHRTAFSDAFNNGSWVGVYAPNSLAHREMTALADRVLKQLEVVA